MKKEKIIKLIYIVTKITTILLSIYLIISFFFDTYICNDPLAELPLPTRYDEIIKLFMNLIVKLYFLLIIINIILIGIIIYKKIKKLIIDQNNKKYIIKITKMNIFIQIIMIIQFLLIQLRIICLY